LNAQIGGDAMTTVLQGTGIVISIAVFLLGVGFLWRKLKSKAVGKKF